MDYEYLLVSNYYSNPGKLFDHLKSVTDSTSFNYPIFHHSKPVTTPQQKAQMFNDYFNSVFMTSDFTLPPENQLPSPTDQLSRITVDTSDVAEALLSLNTSKAPGTDYISPLVLKVCSEPTC